MMVCGRVNLHKTDRNDGLGASSSVLVTEVIVEDARSAEESKPS